MAPNINNPGGVKNDPSEILNALTSDSTKFDGSNIDASISTRATPADTGLGIDWSAKTPRVDRAGRFGSGDLLSVTGSGYVLGFTTVVAEGAPDVVLSLDGTTIHTHPSGYPDSEARDGNAGLITRSNPKNNTKQGLGSLTNCLFRFDSSFTVSNSPDGEIQAEVSYVLD